MSYTDVKIGEVSNMKTLLHEIQNIQDANRVGKLDIRHINANICRMGLYPTYITIIV